MMVDEFSRSLWKIELELEPFSGDRPEMSYSDIQPFLEATGSDEPLLIRIDKTYIPCYQGGSIPYKVLCIPEEIEEALNLDLPTTKQALIPKNQQEITMVLFSALSKDDEENLP